MANRLADETSPYLLKHKDNPVDWYARREQARAGAGTAELTRRGAGRIGGGLEAGALLGPSRDPSGARGVGDAVEILRSSSDRDHGGFGGAPKFPRSAVIGFLLRRGEREMTAK